MSGFQEFSFGEGDGGISGRRKRFKAEGGNTYRVSFIWFRGLSEGKVEFGTEEKPAAPQFNGAQTHFIPNVGYVVNKGPEFTKVAGEAPRARIGTVIVVWPTDKNGKLDKSALAEKGGEVLPWIFSGDKYRSLSQIHEEFPLSFHDVTLACTDTTYQKMTFTPCKESLFKTLAENPKAAERVKALIEAAQAIAGDIQGEIGQELTIEQVREKMAGGTGGTTGGPTGGAAVSSGDIDGMVDGILD